MKPLPAIRKTATGVIRSLFLLSILLVPHMAHAAKLQWTASPEGEVADWFNTILTVVMGIFVMTSIIMGSLAFKQLASDGNWKDFWSKITGAIGMFVVPIAIYFVLGKS